MRLQYVPATCLRHIRSPMRYVFLAWLVFVLFFLPKTILRLVDGQDILTQYLSKALLPMSNGRETFAQLHSPLEGEEEKAVNQRCVHPFLHPYGTMKGFPNVEPLDCSSAMVDWVLVVNGTCYISDQARRTYGNITCEYRPILRDHGDDLIQYGAPVKIMQDGQQHLQTDFFHVSCISSVGKRYNRTHAGAAWNNKLLKRLNGHASQIRGTSSLKTGSLLENFFDKLNTGGSVRMPESKGKFDNALPFQNLSVFMYGFDSISAMAWMRFLPRTRDFFLRTLGGIELEGYNNYGGGTHPNLLPILTGKKQEELPEARKGFLNAKNSIDHFPWIWKMFSQKGYVTAYAEDSPKTSSFNYLYPGFNQQPTDHYLRPFYLGVQTDPTSPSLCSGSTPRHVVAMHYLKGLFEMYKNYPKFFFGFFSEMSHDNNPLIHALDNDVFTFLQDLYQKGHLNSTLLILMSDHGRRLGSYRLTPQGRVEEHMPYFAFRFPPWFQQAYPHIIKNFQKNRKRLTTPLDIHDTFLDILNYSGPGKADLRRRSISLFKEIPPERTCPDAEVGPESCECMEWKPVQTADSVVTKAANAAIAKINNETGFQRRKCAELTLLNITGSGHYTCNPKDGLEQAWNACSPGTELYMVSFVTKPGGGAFQAVCSRELLSGRFSVHENRISRINKYGSQPACVQQQFPHLRPYCYCV